MAPNKTGENCVFETRTSKIWFEDGILRVVHQSHICITLDDAQKNIAAGIKATNGHEAPVLVNIGQIRSVERAARTYLASDELQKNGVAAIALLIASPVSKVIGDFFITLAKPVVPTKLFTSETKALEWLRQFCE
ncbi:MAG: STAS/SEC14 domain-containing protein [Pseudomonadota bacterium]